MADVWGRVVDRLDEHFAEGSSRQHSIAGRRIGAFEPIECRPRHCVYIDGGNAPIFESPSACVQLIRVAAVEYDGAERRATHRKEALCIVTSSPEGYRIDWSGQEWPSLSLVQANDLTVATAADIARRVTEKAFASAFQCLAVFDGDLESRHAVEQAVLDGLTLPHCGLAKTSTLLTDQGQSATAALLRAGPKEAWIHPLADSRAVVKLHALSRRAYLLDARNILLPDAASALCGTNDASFPGYPYGLVEADRLARVTVREQHALAELLRTRLRGRWQEQSGALDAHEVLDSIAGSSSQK